MVAPAAHCVPSAGISQMAASQLFSAFTATSNALHRHGTDMQLWGVFITKLDRDPTQIVSRGMDT